MITPVAYHLSKAPKLFNRLIQHTVAKLIKDAMKGSYVEITHFCFKVLFNKGKSTTSLKRHNWGDDYIADIYHYCREQLDYECITPPAPAPSSIAKEKRGANITPLSTKGIQL